MELTLDLLDRTAGSRVDRSNANSLIIGMRTFAAGIDQPHRLAQFLAQIMHESGSLKFDREIWGPTEAQKRYDTRTNLGNTPAVDGDGFKFRGRTSVQLTGGDNYRGYRDWADDEGLNPPDFEADPDAVLTDPWEGLAPVWFWASRGLNRLADTGDIENVTRRINGGLNGYSDRIRLYARASLAILGRDPGNVRGWQEAVGLKPDGIVGTKTRAMLHARLLAVAETPIAEVLARLDERMDALEARMHRFEVASEAALA